MTQTELFFTPTTPEASPPVHAYAAAQRQAAPALRVVVRAPEVEPEEPVEPEADEPAASSTEAEEQPAEEFPYTVRLVDHPATSADAGDAAAQRFRRELERQLGDAVVPAMRAWRNASESSDVDLAPAEIGLARQWAKAYDAARSAGFRELGDTEEAYFDVRAA